MFVDTATPIVPCDQPCSSCRGVTSSPDIVVKAPAAMIALAAATNAHHARCTRGGGAAVRRLRLMRQACAAGSRATSGSKDNMRKKRAKSSRAPVLLAARAPGPGGCFPVVLPEFRGTSAPPHRGVVYPDSPEGPAGSLAPAPG